MDQLLINLIMNAVCTHIYTLYIYILSYMWFLKLEDPRVTIGFTTKSSSTTGGFDRASKPSGPIMRAAASPMTCAAPGKRLALREAVKDVVHPTGDYSI